MRVIPKGRQFELRMVRGCVSVKIPSDLEDWAAVDTALPGLMITVQSVINRTNGTGSNKPDYLVRIIAPGSLLATTNVAVGVDDNGCAFRIDAKEPVGA